MTKRRWNSFVCPGCRFVFRVPRDHDGQGVVCPSCRVMLRLPGEGEDAPPLMKPATPAPELAAEEPDEEHEFLETAAAEAEESEGSPVALLLTMVMVGGALLAGFWFWLRSHDASADHFTPPIVATKPLPAPRSSEPEVKDTPETYIIREGIRQTEPILRGFLEAKTMDEALKYVHQPDRVRARWTALLGSQPFTSPGFQKMREKSIIATASVLTVKVTTGDFEEKSVSLRIGNGAPKIDWEAWTGWSEMSWADFKKQRPTQAKIFRAYISQADYFNFGFTDDREWSSYRLDSPDGSEVVYGYTPKAKDLDGQIRPMEAKTRIPIILKLRYPEKAPNSDQVIIEGMLGRGWVEP